MDNLTTLQRVAKAFMIVGTVFIAISTFCIGLAWCLPMSKSYNDKLKKGEKVSIGFAVCTLLFVSVVSGICMLCDNN